MVEPVKVTDPPVPHILVVDDDAGVLNLHARVIREMGYHVDTAESGERALEHVAQRCPDVLVADLMLGRMDGEDLARRCMQICPRLRLVFVSGYTPEKLREVGITQVVFLPKPVSPKTLRTALRTLLGEQPTED
jgi:two-component system, cell cycle sensor histidine kinase and response regulator CckA